MNFNNAGASPSPNIVLQTAIEHTMLESQLDWCYAVQTQQSHESEACETIKILINAKSINEIELIESAKVSWKRIFYSLIVKIQKDDVMLCSESEHASNVVDVQN